MQRNRNQRIACCLACSLACSRPRRPRRRVSATSGESRTSSRSNQAMDGTAAARRTARCPGLLVEHDRQSQQPDQSSGRRRACRVARQRAERAPSRVSDPPDGQLPFQPWARARAEEFAAHLDDPSRPEYVEPLARCAPGGPTKSFMWHGYEIRQFPGYVRLHVRLRAPG